MPAWVPQGGGGGGEGGAGGAPTTRKFYSTGSGKPSNTASVYHPAASGGGTGVAGGTPDVQPGVISINPLDPAGSVEAAKDPITGLLDGLKNGIFGTSLPDAEGKHGGLIGDVPIAGDLTRAASEGVAAVGGKVAEQVGAGVGVVGGALERVPFGNPAETQQQFNDPALQAWLDQKDASGKTRREQMGGDNGLLGTGILSNQAHMQAAAIRKFQEEQQVKNPTLFGGKFTPAPTLADTVNSMFDIMGASADVVQRGVAGWAKANGQNQLDMVKAVGSGQASWDTFGAENTPVEQLAYEKTKSGEWTDDQALDWMSSHGAGYSHDVRLQIASTVGLDPLNLATFGAGAVAKAGVKGAQIVRVSAETERLLASTKTALEAAQAGLAEAKGARAIKAATKAVENLTSEVKVMEEAKAADAAFHSTKGVAKVNVIGRQVEGSQKVQALFKQAGKAYEGLEGTYIGRAAKVTRTIIDPLHAIDLHMPGNARAVDLLSDSLTKTLSSSIGDVHYLANLDMTRGLDATGKFADQYARDLATAMSNRGRAGLLTMHQAGNVEKLGKAGADAAHLRDEVIATAAEKGREADLLGWLQYDVTKNILQRNWSPAAHQNLATQLEAIYHFVPDGGWVKSLEGMNAERKSLLKLAAYGRSNSRLLDAVSASAGHASAGLTFADGAGLDRMVLIAKTTLTRQGGDALLSSLKKSKTTKDSVDLVREWQARYPELRYVTIDNANQGKSIKQMVTYLEDRIDKLPMQVKNDELAQMHPDMQELSATLGDGYQLGFRPKDEFLWGIERTNGAGGAYDIVSVPWADHVGEGGLGYRPGRNIPLNIAGMPVIGAPAAKVAKAVDYMEAGTRMFRAQVSGAQIAEAARQRFVSEASRAKFADQGLTESVAQKWWERLQEYTREHQGYSGPRGFGKDELYNAIEREGLVPQTMINGSMRMTSNDVLRMVLEAYDGDIRYIGLTQKLSGRAKKVLSAATGFNSNYAGQISEHAWPTLKFRYNPIFQLQEKTEPFVLNAQRGITPAFTSGKVSEADLATERLLQKMTDNSLIRQSDLDQAEYSAMVLLGRKMGSLSTTPGRRFQKVGAMAQEIMDVQGVKRINMLRTFRQGLGKDLREAWDVAQPGAFDDMFLHAQARVGHTMSEDDFALQFISEQMYANDVIVRQGVGGVSGVAGMRAEWDHAIKPGEWYRPTHLGEVKSLDLDHLAASMQTLGADGKRIENLKDLRRYVAEDHTRVDEVSDYLRRMGADPDYVSRVENALTFSWEGFWREAGQRFSLTSAESKSLQDMIAGSAELRGMQPADFLSQVYHPGILNGTEGIIGSLDAPLGVLRRNKAGDVLGRGRSRLAGKQGVSTRDDLVRQLSGVFSAHLDPSAKRALLLEFRPELRQAVKDGTIRLDIRDLDAMWNADAEGQLADRILGYMDGAPGTGQHDVITDEARGIASIRSGADKYLEKNGVTPLGERRHYQIDDAHYQTVADEYTALPTTPHDITGRRPMTKQVYAADTDLKPQPAGVDDRTYQTYQQFVIETRAQWDHMTAPKGKGGMGIKVTVAKGDPYTADAAGRAAMQKDLLAGKLRVKGTDSDHPLMTNEQNVMFRAVHDVFGHMAEGFEFGPRGELNAAASHFRLYSADARGALLSETHGQTAYVNYSNEVIPTEGPKPLNPTDVVGDYNARYPKADPTENTFYGQGGGYYDTADTFNTPFVYPAPDPVGKGLAALDPKERDVILQQFADLQDQFPDYRMQHIDAPAGFEEPVEDGGLGMPTQTHAAAWGSESTEPTIIMNPRYFDPVNGAGWDGNLQRWVQGFNMPSFDRTPRISAPGTPFNAMQGPEFVINHEFGHAVINRIRMGFGARTLPENKLVNDVLDAFDASGDSKLLSEYAARSGSNVEAHADLFAVMMAPPEQLQFAGVDMKIAKWAEDLRTALVDSGHMKPRQVGTAGKTVREANAAKRGTVYAPQKAGLLSQDSIDTFAKQFVGVGKHVESNPDVARSAQMFGKWSEAAVKNGLLQGDQSIHAGLLNDIAGIPIHSAVPYNLTEGLAHQLANSTMVRKWEDAFRLQYFAQSRSMLERSINHPMFGLYPASYMWGKIMPEVIQFIAQRPLGMKTGGAAYSLMDMQAAIAMQREFNPEFDAKINQLGHSQALSFAGFLLPTLPWDISASAPAWMKDVAAQGQRNKQSVDTGGVVEGFNAVKPVTDVMSRLNPLETTIPWAGRAIDELNGANTAEQQRKELVNQTGAAVGEGEVGSELSAIMAELRDALSR